jgi:hypothetical protein
LLPGKDKGLEEVTMDAKEKNLSILTGHTSVLSVYGQNTLHALAYFNQESDCSVDGKS